MKKINLLLIIITLSVFLFSGCNCGSDKKTITKYDSYLGCEVTILEKKFIVVDYNIYQKNLVLNNGEIISVKLYEKLKTDDEY